MFDVLQLCQIKTALYSEKLIIWPVFNDPGVWSELFPEGGVGRNEEQRRDGQILLGGGGVLPCRPV